MSMGINEFGDMTGTTVALSNVVVSSNMAAYDSAWLVLCIVCRAWMELCGVGAVGLGPGAVLIRCVWASRWRWGGHGCPL
jgi:hypothetical protein